ncbi:MAG: ABC transporter ATP-binding protein [Candidatus Melainabacteria bacterium]|nr:ABC transporter ATP-binding protein [Candidatus Melainabacteria bacterium]
MALLEIRNLSTVFDTENGLVQAVDDLSVSVEAGSVLGIVGESGCGKSVMSLSILRLVPPPGRIGSGEVLFAGEDLLKLAEPKMRTVRGNQIALIPQDPMTSLNPVYTVGEQIIEAIVLHQKVMSKSARQRAIEVLDRVRIPQAASRIDDYPHQFSGGMRQRVMIAMALSCEPRLLIADEPTTALDVTVQAQILDLLRRIQKEQGMSILLITHDLGVVAEMCDMVAVMYAGSIVEYASVVELFARPKHPYSIGLMASVPRPGTTRLVPIDGQPPSLLDLPPGCRFADRCPLVEARCRLSIPPLEEKTPGHFARCVVVPSELGSATLSKVAS